MHVLTDHRVHSGGSVDDLENANWAQEIEDVITNILDRKRSSVQGREEAYAAYCALSKFQYVHDRVFNRVNDLVGAFCKSIKLESSERESTLALRALELLAVSAYDATIFENVEPVLTRTIRDSTSEAVKSTAIHCLGTCAVFGGAGEDGMLDQMNFLLDIVASDGESVGASSVAEPVAAALAEWGHLATFVDDLAAESEEAIQIFADILNCNDSVIQIVAGEAIALLYEKSYSPYVDDGSEDSDAEEEEDEGDHGDDEDEEALLSYNGPKLVKRYDAYHNTSELVRELQSLATAHSKRISKRDKKSLHQSFVSIQTTVEDPRRGPMYSTAIDPETGRHYGSRFSVKVGRDGVMYVDRWWKWVRLNAMRRLFQGGFAAQYYRGNRSMLESLPSVEHRPAQTHAEQGRKRTGRRGDTRRFAIHDQSDGE